MISPFFVDQFAHDAQQYEHLKDKVRDYIIKRYEPCKRHPTSVYSVCFGFQMVIGNIPQSALCHWLNEWGYRVETGKGLDDRNHNVFIRLKDYIKTEDRNEDSKSNFLTKAKY